jgi:hypothetical protein
MKKRNAIVIAAAALLLPACIPSINPFYTDKDVAFESRLLGEWEGKDKDDKQIWKFEEGKEKNSEKAYTLTVTEKDGKHGEFEAHLFKLKEEYFLDIVISDLGADVSDLVAASLIPGHLLLRVPQIEPELKVAPFDFGIVLTAGTADLQSFVLKHLREDELFAKGAELIRKTKKEGLSNPTEKK